MLLLLLLLCLNLCLLLCARVCVRVWVSVFLTHPHTRPPDEPQGFFFWLLLLFLLQGVALAGSDLCKVLSHVYIQSLTSPCASASPRRSTSATGCRASSPPAPSSRVTPWLRDAPWVRLYVRPPYHSGRPWHAWPQSTRLALALKNTPSGGLAAGCVAALARQDVASCQTE